MTPGARLAAAIEIVADMDARHRPVAEALKDWGMSHRFAGAGDRAAIGNIVYDALRRRRSTAFLMGSDAPRAVVLGSIGRDLGADALAVQIDGVPHAPEPLTAEEAGRLLAPADNAAEPVRADVPDWLAPSLRRAFGDDWVAEGEALASRPPLDIRVNRLKAERAKVAKELAAAGAIDSPFSPDGLRVPPTSGNRRHPNVQSEPAFLKGLFEIQDEGSQLAAAMVGARPGMQVLDLCAGAGGKTLALAAAMANKGQLFATDRDKYRLAPIFERIKRAGTRNVQVRAAGADLSDLKGEMDRVMVDAPCTGTGTWRRRPDIKWRLTEHALADRQAEQAAILREAAEFVKPGGRLVYVTCSVLPEENQDQVASFLSDRPDFGAVPAADVIAGAGLPAEFAAKLEAAVIAVPGGVQLTPRRTATDGFFIAVLQKT
ncbi:MAG: RsmB/NOP family class I SAM-dependent RNA methyltransferase [Bauldia sp.]|nr:RsmB/NOP family class I SAM-dependent RNA methyltransferase [Bauldia sp.]